jgi:hypothetical protein
MDSVLVLKLQAPADDRGFCFLDNVPSVPDLPPARKL